MSDAGNFERTDVTFDSWGERCQAWFYETRGAGPAPCVVMAHGWSGVREQALDRFAERFAAAGLSVLLFDYRHFGASDGQPRQLLDVRRQLADWASAISYARTRVTVDPDRIALWGTSFSGGHVLSTAARDRRVAAVVAQAPYVDGLANLPFLGAVHALRLTAEGVKDLVSTLRGPPHMVAAVGRPGELAVMSTPDAEPGFRGIDPAGSTWRNETAARVALTLPLYRPTRSVAAITCPVLYCVCDQDAITPPSAALRAAGRTPGAQVRRYPIGHFDVYVGDGFQRAASDQVDFLTGKLFAGRGEATVRVAQPV